MEQDLSDLLMDQDEEPEPSTPKPILIPIRKKQSPEFQVRAKCQICHVILDFKQMSSHFRSDHGGAKVVCDVIHQVIKNLHVVINDLFNCFNFDYSCSY